MVQNTHRGKASARCFTMNLIIGGAGAVGRHLAEVLTTAGHNITVIDLEASKLLLLGDELDVRTLRGNCAHADVLREAGGADCDMFVAATNQDEVNLLAAANAKGIGAKRCVARVHHSAFFDNRGLDYLQYYHIDSLICPEYATAVAIARTLRHPGALAVEDFASGTIEMQQIKVGDDAPALGIALADLTLPKGVRVATVTRRDHSFLADATTEINSGDIVTLIGEKSQLEAARRLLQTSKIKKKHVVVMGSTSMGVWLCRALRQRHFAVRLFLEGRARAEELAIKLPHVTVIEADPTEPSVFAEEHLAESDAFVALTEDDEQNILAAAQAKSLGTKLAIAVTQRSTYHRLLEHVGIDRAFSPRIVAAREIQLLLEEGPIRVLATLVEGTASVYEIRVGAGPAAGTALKDITFPGPCLIAAVQRGDKVFVPGANDKIERDDCVLAIGRRDMEKKLAQIFVGQ